MELQRYSMMRDPARLDEDWQGQWVQYEDAAALIAAKDAEIAKLNLRLALAVEEVRAWRAWKKRVVRYMTCEQPDPTPQIEALKAASAATDADPVLAKMIGGGE